MKVDEATLRRTISKNIAAYRKAHKDTQAGLAEKLNYSDKSVSKWERGESVPDIYILTQIADLYGITVSNLIGEVEPPKASKPTYHMFILLLSVSLVFAIAAVLFSAFLIAEVPFRAWLFFVYAVIVAGRLVGYPTRNVVGDILPYAVISGAVAAVQCLVLVGIANPWLNILAQTSVCFALYYVANRFLNSTIQREVLGYALGRFRKKKEGRKG